MTLTINGPLPNDSIAVNVRFPYIMYSAAKQMAYKKNTSLSEVIRDAMAQYIHSNGNIPGYCIECGKLNPASANFCADCGNRLSD